MAKIGKACTLAAWSLLIALAGCGRDVMPPTDPLISTPSSSEPVPNVSDAAVVPPTLVLTTADGWGELHTPPGFTPPSGPAYSLILRGENFPLDWAGTAYMYGKFLDGTVMALAWGSGRGLDGSYDMRSATNCPSRLLEAWAVIVSRGRTFESKHIVPAC